jgi:hypothetical protein
MTRFTVPKTFIFRAIPKTSTGKIQRLVLQQMALVVVDLAQVKHVPLHRTAAKIPGDSRRCQ